LLKHKYVVSVDVGGSKIASALVSLNGELLDVVNVRIDERGGEYAVKQLGGLIERHISVAGIESVVGVGVDVPGIVDPAEGYVLFAPNIAGWSGLPLQSMLRDELMKLGVEVPVLVIDDRISAALGEVWRGCARGARNAVVVIVGTGVGAGIIIDGKPYLGSSNVSGALGWMIMKRSPVKVEKGWLEEQISGGAIVKKVVEACSRSSSCGIIRSLCDGDLSKVSAETVFKAHDLGDDAAVQIVKEVAQLLGLAIANVVSILNPEVVVINGSVGIAIAERYLSEIEGIVKMVGQPYAARSVRICKSDLGFRANLLGNAKPYEDPPLMQYIKMHSIKDAPWSSL